MNKRNYLRTVFLSAFDLTSICQYTPPAALADGTQDLGPIFTATVTIPLQVNCMVYSAVTKKIYASVPSSVEGRGNTVTENRVPQNCVVYGLSLQTERELRWLTTR